MTNWRVSSTTGSVTPSLLEPSCSALRCVMRPLQVRTRYRIVISIHRFRSPSVMVINRSHAAALCFRAISSTTEAEAPPRCTSRERGSYCWALSQCSSTPSHRATPTTTARTAPMATALAPPMIRTASSVATGSTATTQSGGVAAPRTQRAPRPASRVNALTQRLQPRWIPLNRPRPGW